MIRSSDLQPSLVNRVKWLSDLYSVLNAKETLYLRFMGSYLAIPLIIDGELHTSSLIPQSLFNVMKFDSPLAVSSIADSLIREIRLLYVYHVLPEPSEEFVPDMYPKRRKSYMVSFSVWCLLGSILLVASILLLLALKCRKLLTNLYPASSVERMSLLSSLSCVCCVSKIPPIFVSPLAFSPFTPMEKSKKKVSMKAANAKATQPIVKEKVGVWDENAHRKVKYTNKQRCLVLASRGVSYRTRHLMKDLEALMPHYKPDVKVFSCLSPL